MRAFMYTHANTKKNTMTDHVRTFTDLFGDDDEEEEDSGGVEGLSDDEAFVEVADAQGPVAADVTRLRQRVWLAKVPAALWAQLHDATTAPADLGDVVVGRYGPASSAPHAAPLTDPAPVRVRL
jgi:hypothetical protein